MTQQESTLPSSRIGLVAVLTILLIAAAVGYVWWSSSRLDKSIEERSIAAQARLDEFDAATGQTTSETTNPDSGAPGTAGEAADDADSDFVAMTIEEQSPARPQSGELTFINRIPGDDYGRVAVLGTDGERRLLSATCERSHVTADVALCLSQGTAGLYKADILDLADPELGSIHSELAALPSRARISADGKWASWTVFVSGSGYQDVDGFSTVVRLRDLELGQSIDLSTYTIVSDETPYHFPEPTFWGVSFADDGEFWVTGRFDGFVDLLQGSAADQTLRPSGIAGSCPSLSPDGKTLVYKRLVIGEAVPNRYQLVARTLATGAEWVLGETGSVDDQVEWLDDETIVYGMHAPDPDSATAGLPEFDVWKLNIAEGSQPELLLPLADSPGVIHSP